MKNNTFYGMTLIAFLSLAFAPTLLGKVMSSDEEALLWRKLYSDPIVARDLRESHSCDACWGKCLESAGVANCCNNEICIGVCDGTYCAPSQMTAPLSTVVTFCSIRCAFEAPR